jgi:hypothetical protein
MSSKSLVVVEADDHGSWPPAGARVRANAHPVRAHSACFLRLIRTMSNDWLKCSVCGGDMKRVKVLPSRLGRQNRFRCTCGHCVDLKDNAPSLPESGPQRLQIEGFQELSGELV